MAHTSIADVEDNDEQTALLRQDGDPQRQHVPAPIARRLYLSHFLSTWNSRVFEFGAVLYLASIFPGTLTPMSAYALFRGLSAILLAPVVGAFIDRGNRLQVVRVSIVFQRFAVAGSCVIFHVLATRLNLGPHGKMALLVLITLFACVEKLCSIMNLVSVEKDWVMVIAATDPETLRILNAQMRRIDLLCKLFGPLCIALIDSYSTKTAIIVTFAMNAASVIVEYFAIAWVYYQVPGLQEPKMISQQPETPSDVANTSLKRLTGMVKKSVKYFSFYIRHRAFLPSIAGAALYLTVLSFSGQMVTYLLSAGYTSTQVGIARTLSVAFEVLATWIAPWLMGWIGPVRAGLWLSNWQVTMLVLGVAIFWMNGNDPLTSAGGLVGGTILSRLGLRGFDLCVQIIVQEEVQAESRGAFSSVEAAWQNAFELLAYASTIIFSHPKQFRWPALISVLAVALACAAYTTFVYLRRGHLLHLDALRTFLQTARGKQRERERCIDRITSESEV